MCKICCMSEIVCFETYTKTFTICSLWSKRKCLCNRYDTSLAKHWQTAARIKTTPMFCALKHTWVHLSASFIRAHSVIAERVVSPLQRNPEIPHDYETQMVNVDSFHCVYIQVYANPPLNECSLWLTANGSGVVLINRGNAAGGKYWKKVCTAEVTLNIM